MAFSALALTGDSASIRVWGSHIRVHLGIAIKSGHVTDDRLRRVPGRRKKSKKPLRGGVCLLTKGVLIRVRLRPELPPRPGPLCSLPTPLERNGSPYLFLSGLLRETIVLSPRCTTRGTYKKRRLIFAPLQPSRSLE